MKHKRLVAAASLLAAGTIVLSGCEVPHTSMAYASEVVTCGGKAAINASGSTAQANAMKWFVSAYGKACPGHTLNYTPNGSGDGISDFLAGKTDFAGSDTPLSDDQYATAKQRCGGPTPGTCPWYSARWPLPTTSTTPTFWCSTRRRWPGSSTAASSAGTTRPSPRSTRPCRRRTSRSSTAAINPAAPPTSRRTCRPPVIYPATNPAARPTSRPTSGVRRSLDPGHGQGVQRRRRHRRKGNEGTSATVKNTEGAITYNELSFAMDEGLYAAEIKTPASRKSRRPVRIGTDSVGKTIAGAKFVGKGNDLVLDLSSFYNPTQDDVYPIVLATYEIVCSKYPDPAVGAGGQSGPAGDAGPRPDRPRQARLHPAAARLPIASLQRGRRHQLICQGRSRTHRNPMWVVAVSCDCGDRAAGRYRWQYSGAHRCEPPLSVCAMVGSAGPDGAQQAFGG